MEKPLDEKALEASEAFLQEWFGAKEEGAHWSHGFSNDVVESVLEAFNLSISAYLEATQAGESEAFQARVKPWMLACFGEEISEDKLERNDRFIEEALELVQASDYPKERALALVDYVYDRDQGEINQEVGGVMVTLAAHCLAHGVDMHKAAETELSRIWTKVEKIREKQAAKPTGSALPIAANNPPSFAAVQADNERLREDAERWRALTSSERIRFIGSAGFDHGKEGQVSVDEKRDGWLHFGMEVWDVYPGFDETSNPAYRTGKNLLIAYADDLRSRAALAGQENRE